MKTSKLEMKEYDDFSNVIANCCVYNGDNEFTINGADPYIIISNVNSEMKNLDISLSSENAAYVSVYYNVGTGFNQENSMTRLVENDKVHFRLKNVNVQDLRIDFEGFNENAIVKINSIKINSKSDITKYILFTCLLLLIGIIVTSLRLLKRNKEIWNYICLVSLFGIMYCFKNILIQQLPPYIIISALILVILLDAIVLLLQEEVSHEETAS